MKLPGTLLQAMAIGITVIVVSGGCHKNDVNSATSKKEKEKKERVTKRNPDYCPACGMG